MTTPGGEHARLLAALEEYRRAATTLQLAGVNPDEADTWRAQSQHVTRAEQLLDDTGELMPTQQGEATRALAHAFLALLPIVASVEQQLARCAATLERAAAAWDELLADTSTDSDSDTTTD